MNVSKISAVSVPSFRANTPTEKTQEEGNKPKISKKTIGIGATAAVGAALGAVALYNHCKTPKAPVAMNTVNTQVEKYLQTPQAHENQRLIDRFRTLGDIDKLNNQIAETKAHLQPDYRKSRLEALRETFADADKVENQIVFSRDEVVAQALQAAQETVQKAA